MFNFNSRFYPILTEICSEDYIENFKTREDVLTILIIHLRWEITKEGCFIINNNFKAWFEIRRRRGEDNVITNSEKHSENGNQDEEYMKAVFQNIPGYKVTHKDMELAIKNVLEEHHPALLGIAEPTYNILKNMWSPATSWSRAS